jgi:glucose-6-phosphate isomerase
MHGHYSVSGRFVSNIDGTDCSRQDIDVAKLFYRILKTFTTMETMTNAFQPMNG